jgi:hypothetical protein
VPEAFFTGVPVLTALVVAWFAGRAVYRLLKGRA